MCIVPVYITTRHSGHQNGQVASFPEIDFQPRRICFMKTNCLFLIPLLSIKCCFLFFNLELKNSPPGGWRDGLLSKMFATQALGPEFGSSESTL